MSHDIKLVVDVMSGDIEPRLCIIACANFVERHTDAHITLVGDSAVIRSFIPNTHPRLSIHSALEVVAMDDSPSTALRHKKNSSMFQAISLLANSDNGACISAGNTGALMAIGTHLLKKIEGVTRPALAKAMPTVNGTTLLLDIGANVDCNSQQLLEFALMGTALAHSEGISKPRVALLSNGHEQTKGTKTLKHAAQRLEAHPDIHYSGFIEGDAVFNRPVDVVVCDGFVGNVALKISEGASRFIAYDLKRTVNESLLKRVVFSLVKPILRPWLQKFLPDNYNGAAFIGLQSILVKSHGSSSQEGFTQALNFAYRQTKNTTGSTVKHYLEHLSN